MKKMKYFVLVTLWLSLLVPGMAFAKKNETVLEGEYVPVGGWGKTMEVGRLALGELPNQLGRFKIKLERLGWSDLPREDKKRIAKKVEIEGVLRGAMNVNFTFNHTFANEQRTGVMYTQSDILIPSQGDLFCSTGVPFTGTEQLNFVSGAGDYAQLTSGTLYVSVIVNNCMGQDDYLQNEITVNKNVGSLIFAAQ